jgi:hypothetical protein
MTSGTLVHELLTGFDFTFWCLGLCSETSSYQMIRLRWGASQVPAKARNIPPPYSIWWLRSSLGASRLPSLPISFVFYPDYDPPWIGGRIGGSPAIVKVVLSALFRLSFLPPTPPFILFGSLRSRTPASKWLRTIFQLLTIFYTCPGRCRNSWSPQNLNDTNVS